MSWDLDPPLARLRLGGMSATVDLSRPECGLTDCHAAGTSLRGAALMGIRFPAAHDQIAPALAECYQRGPDLIATYQELPGWPVRADVMWRAATASRAGGILAVLDLTVSVRTELFDVWPEVAAASDIPATDLLWLVDTDSARFEPCPHLGHVPVVMDRQARPGCALFRLKKVGLSYAEMVHPADCAQSEVSRGARLGPVEIRHRLFAERLERGVILRARVRGVLADRADDTRRVASYYTAFAAAEPPLGA